MLKRDECGCLYLTHGQDVVFLAAACDDDIYSEPWRLREGDRRGEDPLVPVSDDEARKVFKAWGELMTDGYAARSIASSLTWINKRREQREGE